jgi:hypothetical protein
MKRSLCAGGLASAERLLAEGEDYSRVEGNVNGYFHQQIDFKGIRSVSVFISNIDPT